MTCNNDCPMKENGNCSCDFFKKCIQMVPKILIWSLPILLGLIYLVFYLYFKDEKWIKDLAPNAAFIGVFFGGTLTYYGVLYTLTYRVKVEVLSKNRQDWINSVRNELTMYFSYCSDMTKNIYTLPSKETYKQTLSNLNISYNKIFLYLNKNEYISHSLLIIMQEMHRDIIRMIYLLEISEELKANYDSSHNITLTLSVYLFNYDDTKVDDLLSFLKTRSYIDISQVTNYLKAYGKEIETFYVALNSIRNEINSKEKYKVNIPNNYPSDKTVLHKELQEVFQQLATICLKEEWERVKKAK